MRAGSRSPRRSGRRFQTGEHGSSGVDVTVALEDPSKAAAARAAIHEHFRCGGGVDAVTVR